MKDNYGNGFWIFIAIVLTILFVFLTISDYYKDKACNELGFENDRKISFIDYCEDKEGNLHYVKFDCTLFECTAKQISVGDVRVKE